MISIEIEIRGKKIRAVIVPYHLRSEAPPYARAVLPDQLYPAAKRSKLPDETADRARNLLERALENSDWRQKQCINLIPSEQTASTLSRLLTIIDPSGRYAEHKKVKAFYEADVFYYQGADFICEIEELLQEAASGVSGLPPGGNPYHFRPDGQHHCISALWWIISTVPIEKTNNAVLGRSSTTTSSGGGISRPSPWEH